MAKVMRKEMSVQIKLRQLTPLEYEKMILKGGVHANVSGILFMR